MPKGSDGNDLMDSERVFAVMLRKAAHAAEGRRVEAVAETSGFQPLTQLAGSIALNYPIPAFHPTVRSSLNQSFQLSKEKMSIRVLRSSVTLRCAIGSHSLIRVYYGLQPFPLLKQHVFKPFPRISAPKSSNSFVIYQENNA